MTQPRAILFDLDGVLVKSEEAWFRLLEEGGQRFRGRPVTREEFTPTFGQGTDADVASFGLRCTPAELDRFYAEGFSRYAHELWVNPEAKNTLEALATRGIRLAVATNTVSGLARQVLDAVGLTAYFGVIACANLVPAPKPAPDLLLFACRGLQVSPAEAWMVGDSRFDRGAAGAAGIHFVGYGLDGDRRIDRFGELLSLLPDPR